VFRGTAAYFDAAGLVALGALLGGLGSRSLYTTSTIDQVARFWVAEQMCGMHAALPQIDLDRCRLTVLVGTNPPVSHGHVGSWPDPVVRLRTIAGTGELWCLDVRRTETAALAHHHVAPRPGTDWAVLGHVVREVLDEGADAAFVAAHTSGVAALRAAVAPLTRTRAAAIADVGVETLDALVASVRRAGRLALQTGTGTTMAPFGDVTEWMAWALCAITGSFDAPGGMWFGPGFLRGRPRGGSPAHEPGPASRPGLEGRFGERPTAALVDEIEAGNVRALLVVGGNPLRAVPGTARLRAAVERLDVLAVADIVEGATVAAATHVLACAAQLERADVAMVESMYPLPGSQYTPALLAPPGGATPLFDLLGGLVTRLGLRIPAADTETLFDALAGERAASLREERVLLGEPAFGWFTESVLPEGRWRLATDALAARLGAALDATQRNGVDRTSLLLTPRRQAGHMNTLLAGRSDTPDLLVHPDDAARLGVVDGAPARIAAAASAVEVVVRVDAGIRPGAVSLPHGFESPNISDLTIDTDTVHPVTGMPVLAAVPVTVTPVAAPS
jgi:anaerobic selenocysteine-containing dehydrogenase